VRLSPVGTSATNWPIVPAPDDRWWVWSSRWNENWQGKPKYSEKTCPSSTLSTTNPTLPDLGSIPDRSGGKPATNRLSCGTARRTVSARKYENGALWVWFTNPQLRGERIYIHEASQLVSVSSYGIRVKIWRHMKRAGKRPPIIPHVL
jgi:hypothetical protein